MRRSFVIATAAVAMCLGMVVSACGSDGGGPEVQLSAAGEQGKTVAREQGCISCHTADGGKSTGPTWKGLAGSTVTLDDGTEVVADDAYLREAILQSRGQVVEGYANVMPVYEGELSDDELDALIAYIEELSPQEGERGSGGY